MNPHGHPRTGERGIALVMAMLVLLVISLLAALLIASVRVETKITGRDLRSSQALNIAEAGVGEVLARLRNGDVPDNGNPRMVTQIFNTTAGSVPVPGNADTIAMETAQPAGQWLNYSTAGKGPNVLTVEYKTDPTRTQIYRYDNSVNPAIQFASGLPIFKITSVGRKGLDNRKVVTEVIQKPYNALVNAALAADVGIDFSGTSDVCGYNHDVNTVTGTRIVTPCSADHLASGHLPGSWSTGTVTSSGSGLQNGTPVNNAQNQSGFYEGPWEALGMSQAEFFSWIGAGQATAPEPPVGIVYLDNNSIARDRSGSWAYQGGDGEGLLYVDGDLAVNGNFNFRGLIYVEGDVKINGTMWCLGAMIVKGVTTIKVANGTATILYSKDAITQNIAKHGGQFVTLTWRETPVP